MKGHNSLAKLNEEVEQKQCEYEKSKKRHDGNITGHWRSFRDLRTEQLKAECEARHDRT